MRPIAETDDADLDHDITVIAHPRIAEGYFVAWKDGELLTWGHLGRQPYPTEADTVALSVADYGRLMEAQAVHDALEIVHGTA